jgi:hypothetical protein
VLDPEGVGEGALGVVGPAASAFIEREVVDDVGEQVRLPCRRAGVAAQADVKLCA